MKRLSPVRLNRLRTQGFTRQDESKLSEMAFGIRFPYRACLAVLILAIATQSIALFSLMFALAFLGTILPNHPFDYLYNHAFRPWMGTPEVPVRSQQMKFACVIATLFLVAVVSLLHGGLITEGLIVAGVLAAFVLLPSTIDLCIPSLIYIHFLKSGKQESCGGKQLNE